jgi:dihydropteroate synthase
MNYLTDPFSTQIMGIVNVTPDSFFDGGKHFSTEQAVEHGIKLYEEGADILDIGGESTRPSSLRVSEEEELRRVIPVIEQLRTQVPITLSIDTMKTNVAAAAIAAGATLINDVTGFRDPAMREVAASAPDVRLCVMHMQGTPETMQMHPHYPEGVVNAILAWFEGRIEELLQVGIREENIILDPGIGFGKTAEQNLEIIAHLSTFKALGFPVLLGVSRKSFLQKILKKSATESLSSTLAVNTIGVLSQVDIIRVHDVREHREMIDLVGHCTKGLYRGINADSRSHH